ncbi:hypothetical protein SLS62_004688 [Diatrype stigma]|uniref:O-methyltransferase domain-containing protein n=1 Tax=Diatrype stigma TaxID=117547 RepID=A0AAN9V4M0_9PEZI
MSAYRAGRPSWADPDFRPFSDPLSNGFDPGISEVINVHVGGGMGHGLLELKEKHPGLAGKLVLQDLPEVISTVTGIEGAFEFMPHDFFTPQPVKDLKSTTKRGDFRVLINEITVPSQNLTWPITSMDQLVFVFGAMRVRTEAHWRSIFETPGFKVVQIYSYELSSESLIEPELA